MGHGVRTCAAAWHACMHGQGASMNGSHVFCYSNGFLRTTDQQGKDGFVYAVGAAAATGLSQLKFVGHPIYIMYPPFPW
jgi:hypothetical protein